MYHLRKIRTMLLVLLLSVTAQAQIENGKVYNFVNVANEGKSLTYVSNSKLAISSTDVNDFKQLWYVVQNNDNSYSLRSLENGYYLKSPNAQSNTNWTLVKAIEDNCKFTCVDLGSGAYTLRASNTTNDGYSMHYGSGTGSIVCWNTQGNATKWTISSVEVPAETMSGNWEIIEAADNKSTYEAALGVLFTDNSCSELKTAYASYTMAQMKNDENYQKLPATLQAMVLKMCTDGTWQEDNYDETKSYWDADYAKKYRVQLYEPYNEPEAAASALGLNAHTNLNNPTGIFANNRQPLYVMVEGTIEEGASLYLASYTGHGKLGGYKGGIELTKGLNIIPSNGDGNNYCINYVVHTFDTSKGKGNDAKAYRLSDFDDLKIHIEGGYINGYWNKMGDELYTPDTDDDWLYIEERATQTDVTVLGQYITLQFPLVDEATEGNKGLHAYYNDMVSIKASIDEWDKVMLWERIVLGVLSEDVTKAYALKSPYSDKPYVFEYTGNDTDGYESGYGDYYNVHGLSYGVGGNAYMYGGWDHCGYHYNTMKDIMVSMVTDAGAHWGPGHEIGHQHQKLLTVNGLTEVTNNLFSNIVLWYFGKTTSRVNGSALEPIQEVFSDEGTDFFSTTDNVFITTQLYYKFFLYYHVLGHNPKFYPKLFEMLRQDPMSSGYYQDGGKTLLHFYKKCCDAAGEDLTEFFRAYGFFRVMEDRFVGDYANSVYNQTQEQIDAAIAEVKAKGYPENVAVLFINDDTGEEILSHTGEVLKPYEEANSEMGCYATFAEENAAAASGYTLTLSGDEVTMSGAGGVGYAIYNANGEIIAFSDKATFAVSEECKAAIATGEAVVKVVNADNTEAPATITDEAAVKAEAFSTLLDKVKAIIDLQDATETKVGYYKSSAVIDLDAAYKEAKSVFDAGSVDAYAEAHNKLYQAYEEVVNDEYARIGIVEGNAYRLVCKAYSDRSMSINSSKEMLGETTNESSDAQLWYFEASSSGAYYLKNKSTQTYPGKVSTGAVLSATATSTTDGAHAYSLKDMGNGVWALVGNTGLHCSKSQSYNIVGWGAEAEASQWYITAVEVDKSAEARKALNELIEKTEPLLEEMNATEITKQTLTLQTESSSNAFWLSTNACHNTLNGASDGQGLAGLLDGSTETYFHSDWGGKVTDTHYLQVDLGNGNAMDLFTFSYTTRANGANHPVTIEVTGSTDGTNFTTDLGTYSNLPTGGAQSWESPLINDKASCRYLRFSVTKAAGDNIFFVMSSFGITKCEANMGGCYGTAGLTKDVLLNANAEYVEAQTLEADATATETALTAECSELESCYTALKTFYDDVQAVKLNALKSQLETLINSTNSLIGECGTVTYTPTTNSELDLQTTTSTAPFYVSTNAQENKEGPIANLVDGNPDTHFHSEYETNVEANHYVQVDLGAGNETSMFSFEYMTRKAETNFPKTIEVYGSTDGNDYKLITKVTDLPVGNSSSNVTYTSPCIKSEEEYAHLRFVVTANNSGGKEAGGHPFFHMAELTITVVAPESYSATLNSGAGSATEEQLIEVYKQVASAQGVYNYGSTELEYEKAIELLQAKYDELLTAKNLKTDVAYTVSVVGINNKGGVIYEGTSHAGGTTFDAPQTLAVVDLSAINLNDATYTAGEVALSGTTITVTYKRIYTVQITGGKGNGNVTYNQKTYAHGETIQVVGEIDANQIVAAELNGYNKATATVDHSKAIISVTFTMPPLVDTNKYYTLECVATDGHSSTRFILDNGTVINGQSSEGSLFIFEKADDENGYYIKSYATDKYLNHNGTNISASATKSTVWSMAEPTHTENVVTLTIGGDKYLNNNGSDCADNSCKNLKANLHKGGPGSGNKCSLWTLTEGTPLDKSELNTLMTETNALITDAAQYSGSANVTEDLVDAVEAEVANAKAKYESKATTPSEYAAALAALQTAHDNLQTAIAYATLPVQLTFDAASPVTYKISIKRNGLPVLSYDESSKKVAVTNFKLGNKAHGWYFMASTDGKVYIMPYYDKNTTLALGVNDFSVGAGKVNAVEKDNAQGWTITANTSNESWYNITTINPTNTATTWYFSHHGGGTNNMGFYNVANDDGSLFQFEKVTFDKSEAYYTLYNYFHGETKVKSSDFEGNDEKVGYYPVAEANAYKTAYSNATSVLESATATDEEYTNAYNELKAANEALKLNMPEEGKFYRLRSVKRGTEENPEYAYVKPEENRIFHTSSRGVSDATTIWCFVEMSNGGTYKMTNLHTGTSFANNGWEWYTALPLYDEAEGVNIVSLSTDGQVGFKCDGIMLHADGNGKVVHWETGANDASAWRIEEVEDMSAVNFALTIGKYRHAGLYLNYAAKIPEGVEVFIAHTPDENDATIYADKIEGTVLPAHTAVIVKGNAATYNFKYTTSEYDGTDDLSVNKLGGSAYLKYQQVVQKGNRCCVFGVKSGEVGLYKNYVEYIDAKGAQNSTEGEGDEATTTSYVDTDNGTHFKILANKIYYEYEPTAVSGASAFHFRFNSREEGTTTIDELILGNDTIIYNLYGQRIVRVVEPGLYIINGKKTYVSEVMIHGNN